ncbi:hypothetical protein DSO57_1018936 [Entomophthora muscae]|uniref:Uncharacterized protein n=1 Tax=Entomophthora muscae TaxID=34485 RepID=A0ACC2T4A5_9FUNG|nr:hypothetical protein DSO57_1018936 [Entomophthora muscae]
MATVDIFNVDMGAVVHSSTGISPFKANYRFDPTWDHLPTEEASNPKEQDWVAAIHTTQEECAQNLKQDVQIYKYFSDKRRSP